MAEEKQPKTFAEIEAELKNNLQKIKVDILDMERNIEIGQEMLEREIETNPGGETIFKYKNDLAELETGLGVFKQLEIQLGQTLENLYDTMKKAGEYIHPVK